MGTDGVPISPTVRLRDQRLEGLEIAEHRIDIAVIADVIAVVRDRRRVDRREPDRVDPEPLQVSESPSHPSDVADAVAVRILKRTRINLIDDGLSPPLACHCRAFSHVRA